ncbi:unnamed protein product [Polarella glacialis]|uniref:Uncharacterized protein n=1 Tax=Polarella glacialis TaxID=89957 RepID=A0A813K8X5_POLGL|nr:unnamed protein product [Polarella glacialis]
MPADAEDPVSAMDLEQPSEVAELRRENQRLTRENQRLTRENLRLAALESQRLQRCRVLQHALQDLAKATARVQVLSHALLDDAGAAELQEMSVEQDDTFVDDTSEPENTIATTSSIRRRAARAGMSTTVEVKERMKEFERSGYKFTQPADMRQYLAKNDLPRLPEYTRQSQERTLDFHNPWRNNDVPFAGLAGHPQTSLTSAIVDDVWPERLTIKELQESGNQEEQARLAPLIKRMTLLREVTFKEFKGMLDNLSVDLEVEDVRLGWMKCGVTPLATVAFRTSQKAQELRSELRSSPLSDLVWEVKDWQFQGADTDRSESRCRLFFKNVYQVEDPDLAEHLEGHLARCFGGSRVCVNYYWDGQQKVRHPTDRIVSGYVDFEDEKHAELLMKALQKRRGDHVEYMVLTQITGVTTPIAFQRHSAYQSRDS